MRKMKKTSLAASAAAGILCAEALTVILCLPFAWSASLGRMPMAAMPLWALISAGLAVFLATMAVFRLRRRQALPTAGLIAGGYLLLSVVICAATGGCGAFWPWFFRVCAAVLAGGMLGAFMSIRKKKRKK